MAQPGGGSVDHGREPCPDRILDDIGGAFGMGAVGGGIWKVSSGYPSTYQVSTADRFAGYVTPEDLFCALQCLLTERNVSFLVAPYSAWAQVGRIWFDADTHR